MASYCFGRDLHESAGSGSRLSVCQCCGESVLESRFGLSLSSFLPERSQHSFSHYPPLYMLFPSQIWLQIPKYSLDDKMSPRKETTPLLDSEPKPSHSNQFSMSHRTDASLFYQTKDAPLIGCHLAKPFIIIFG